MALYLKNCWVVDANVSQPRHATVVIERSRIKAVRTGDQENLERPSDSDIVYDLGGAYVLPGLWDCHTHPGLLIDSVPNALLMAFESETERAFRSARNCMDALSIGFTGLRAVGEANFIDVALRDAFNQETLTGPRLYASGPSLKITGGHGAHGRRHNVYAPMHVETNGTDGFRAAARHNLKMGVDWIKLLITGGIAGSRERMDESQMTREEIEAVTDAAHAKGIRVCAHSGSASATKTAILAGVDCIEHGYQLDQETVDLMVEKGTYLVPTLIVTQDREMMEKYDWSDTGISKALAGAKAHREAFEMALSAGVKIAMGADWSPIIDASPRELEWMARCGMPPHQVIAAATITAAELCGVAEELGTVEMGKKADLLIVGMNPLDDISNLRDVEMVIKDGRIVANPAERIPQTDNVR